MSRERKILLIMPELYMGGAETQFRYLIEYAEEKHWKLDVLIEHRYKSKEKKDLEFIKEHKNIRFIEMNIKALQNDSMIMKKIITNHLKSHYYSCLIYYTCDLMFVPLLRLFGMKVIYSERVDASYIETNVAYKLCIKLCNNIVANSKYAQNQLKVKFEKKAKLIRNGIPFSNCISANIKTNRSIQRILLPARIAPVKNQIMVLRFLTQTNLFKGKIIFAGEIQDRNYFYKLKKFVMDYNLENQVEFLGNVDNISEEYEKADLVILPSLAEGTPNVVLESYLNYRPIIVSDIEPEKDVVLNPNLRFALKNIHEIETCIKYIMHLSTEEYQQLLINNKEYVLRHYRIECMAQKYYRLLTT